MKTRNNRPVYNSEVKERTFWGTANKYINFKDKVKINLFLILKKKTFLFVLSSN